MLGQWDGNDSDNNYVEGVLSIRLHKGSQIYPHRKGIISAPFKDKDTSTKGNRKKEPSISCRSHDRSVILNSRWGSLHFDIEHLHFF